ncbi:unnamed protein product [Adineta steineri]|uniref:ATP-dependent DNA helicase n=1 Tax=Adineta steineri TaxID=433720 RepID=A0A819SJB0_9BILA|nr:unnamed protein product [Adineta steineri]
MPMSEIPNIHLLKISDELKNLVINTQSSTSKNSNGSSISKSSYFYYENDIILYVNGIYQENNVNMCILCQKCSNGLSKEQIPKFSVANNMWLGDIPVELQGLTIPEEKLISLHRHNSCIIKLQSPFHSMATAQGALKGNCITFLQNTPKIVNSLPLKMADLCDTLKVIFIGARPPERLQLKRILTVRKKKIVEALRWLKKYNILYKNIDINLDNIAQLPEDDIPESIMTTMEQILNDKEVPSERAGYIPDPLSNSTELNISDVIPINNSAVLDVNGSSISSEEINNCLLNKIKNGGTNDEMNVENVYLIPHSSKPVNEYFNPKLLAGLYPTLFCYGLGAPEDQTRPLTINLREHIRYLLSYNDRRFETNHSFIFVVFNLLQRRNACFHTQLIATKPYFRSSAQEIHSLNTSDIEAALKNISTRTYNKGSNKALGKLVNHIKTIGGRVMGSAYSRTSLRTHLHAMIFNQSLPNIFLTLNPADIHSPVALYFAGVKLDLDNVQAEQLMDAYKRAEIIASHPVATAKFFHILISNILDTMILGGVVGPVKAYFGTVESQGRGSLHLHLLIWLNHDLKPADMKNKIQDPSFRENLIAYLEDIIKEDLDEFKDKCVFENLDGIRDFFNFNIAFFFYIAALRSVNTPTRLSSDNIYAALRTIDLAGLEENTNEDGIRLTPMKDQSSPSIPYASPPNLRGSPSIPYASPQRTELLQTPIHDQSISSMDVSDIQPRLPPSYLPTPNPSLPNFWSRFCADVTQLVESGNVHRHSDTCYKYCKAMEKKICRLIMPRKLISVSTIDPETGHISMRRSHPWINNFNEYIISACRSNMDIKFIWTGSDAKALVYYITDYITKTSLSFHDTFSLIQKSITSFKNVADQTETESAIEKSRKLVLRCYNTLASQQELSGVQVASYLMNWCDHYTTHKFQALYLIQTEIFLQSELNELRIKQNLEHASHEQHPQATTYLLTEYSEAHIPILYGPQIPRHDREDTKERYSRALLTLFVPWRSVSDLCDVNENWEDALKSRQHHISADSWNIIENIQLLHECKKDRDEHLLRVITEAQTENDTIDPELVITSRNMRDEYDDISDNEDLLELLGNLNEYTTNALNSTKKTTENIYIEETIEAVEKVGRFTHTRKNSQSLVNESSRDHFQQIVPFVSVTPNLVRLNTKWQVQLKTEKERVRRSLITGKYDKTDDTLDYDSIQDALVTMVNSNNYNINTLNNYTQILPVASVTTTSYSTQHSIIVEYTLNREQRAAFMIITSHLDGDKERHKGTNNGQLIMCIPGCGGTGKSQLIRAVTKYFLVTKRIQMMRKLAPTGIAAAEIGGMTIHSFLGEQPNSGKPRTIKPGDSKLEKQWALVE